MKGLSLFSIALQIVTCLTTDNTTMTLDLNITTTTTTTQPPRLTKQTQPSKPPSKTPLKTDAPMLNYIFDAHSSKGKHHHHDSYKWGPHFEQADIDINGTTVTVQVGGTAVLNCRIIYLQEKTISWVRRKEGGNDLELLTVGRHTYSGDDRYSVEFQYPGNWRLQIKFVNKQDEGMYECQMSTHPPKVIQIFLYINAPEVVIVDEHGIALQDKYYETDSTLQLSCIVRHKAMTSSVVHWSHGDKILNYDTTRGGISVKTELMEAGANSSLSIARVNKSDSGNYTCSVSTTEYSTVTVHVLNEESLAELHHGSRCSVVWSLRLLVLLASITTLATR